jgi:alkanesulfonate monooxygenase SsuD/methylene tetrahydromethanopterin reductase-like flavin-dependent oxidoreductase (luciferase family)
MRYGAHLPLIDLDGRGPAHADLLAYVAAARRLGFRTVCANDHLVFRRPWLDAVVALAGVLEHSGDLRLATTVALPVVRGPAALAKAAAALDLLSGGRLVLGVGPGSSAGDYRAAGVPFDERWPRFDESVRALRTYLGRDPDAFTGRFYAADGPLQPPPARPGRPPIWVASWGSDAGLRRVARLGDGWLASAYNTTPARAARARDALGAALARQGRRLDGFPCALATAWTYVTADRRDRDDRLAALAALLDRPVADLAGRVLVGPAEACAATLRGYASAGFDEVFIWPLGDPADQLERFVREVVPLV